MINSFCSVCYFIRTDMIDGVCRCCRESSLKRICDNLKIGDCQN